jgi:trimeric autotransporter adhesin
MMKNFFRALTCVLLLGGASTMALQAQTIPATVSASGSDYFMYLNYSSFNGSIGCQSCVTAGCICQYSNRQTWYFYSGCGSFNGCCFQSSDGASHSQQGGYSTNGGSYTYTVGPDVTQRYAMRYRQQRSQDCGNSCDEWRWTSCFTTSTNNTKPPVNLQAQDGVEYTSIDLTWDKGTSDIPDAQLRYRVYKNGTLVYTTTSNGQRSWTDTGMNPGEYHTYKVRSVYTPTNKESFDWASPSDAGNTRPLILTASDFEFPNRTRLTWPNVSSYADEIRVYRGAEELTILSSNSTSYNDYDGIPGVVYSYSVEAIAPNGSAYPRIYDNGSRRPNGRISGEVKTPFNAGVSGVIVTATASINGVDTSYSDTTDASGFYDIRNVYYHEEAEYTVTPSKPDHGFNPGSTDRTLDVLSPVVSNVNFTDTTVFSVTGKVHFPVLSAGDTCWIQGADVLLDGNPTGIQTNFQGRYALGIQELGNHSVAVRYNHHTFSPAAYTLNITDNFFNQDFINTTTDTLQVKVKGGCGNIIADSASFTVRSLDPGNCFSQAYMTNASGVSTLVLPAQDYEVEVTAVFVNGQNDMNILSYFDPIVVDLTVRDSIVSPTDSTQMLAVFAKADFIYHSAIEIVVSNLPDPVCGPGGILYLMEQGEQLLLEVEVMETHTYPDLQSCLVDTGVVTFVDNISEIDPVTLPLVDGRVYYPLNPGVPNIAGGGAHPYQKLLQLQAEVGFSDPVTEDVWALVTGHRPREQTFVTRTPELPFFVVHDPQGDASYSYLEQGTSLSYAYSNSVQLGGGAGIYWDIQIGAGIPIPFTGIVIGASTQIEGSAIAGRDDTDRDAAVTTWTTNQQFSTSGNDDLIGSDGDVFVGASYNMIYALTDVIGYDPNTCDIVQDVSIVWGADDIATTYIYTESHIANTLIPQLYLLRELANGDSVQLIQSYIDVWEQVLEKNALNKQQATPVQNYSFSAGAPFESSTTLENESSLEIEYNIFIETEVAIGVGVGDGGTFANTEFGVKANFKWNTSRTETTTTGSSKTVGFHLDDDDQGDFFSVDVKKDKVYGTPVFSLVAGTTSCPFEEGSQPRDEPQITMDGYVANNVPANGSAVFVANLANLSQSGETRQYSVRTVNESNLDGAIIKLGGQVITTTPVTYSIPALQSIPVLLTVERGPLANTYEDLQVVMYAACDEGQADTITFTANFQSQCSEVQLYLPDNNWVANASNNNNLYTVFTGFNVNDPNLIDVRLQYRRTGQGWQTATIIPASQLTQQYYNYNFDISGIPDGSYELRAVANCGAQVGLNYSPVKSGIIDRSSINLFGVPTPADGVLNLDEVISVTFNENIDCDLLYDPVDITLVRNDNGQNIPITFNCSGNTILIETNPTTLLDQLENVMLTATVTNLSDFNGNELGNPVVWTFGVNRGQVYWDPSNVVASSVVNQTGSFTSDLRNVSNAAQSFTLTDVPSWLVPSTTSGSVPTGGVVPVSFTISNSLDLGIYEDTVVATINGQEQFLFVRVEVNALAPDWTVNPADFQYSMSVTGQFSISALDVPLSSDTRDMIAAFVNGECRGVAHIAYVPNLNVYSAFMTVYGDQPFGEEVEFRFWDAYPGTEYQAVEELVFIADQAVGQPLAPYILHPGGVFQSIAFDAGWNWFSLNVTAPDMSVDNILATIAASDGDVVKTQDAYAQYSAASGWEGDLTQFSNDRSYQISLGQASTLRILGVPLPDEHTVPVVSGWNWVGYPRLGINPVTPMLDSYAATQGDLIKSESEFATYDNGTGEWFGSLAAMKPGRGYKLRAANPGALDYRGAAAAAEPEDCEHFQLFENNMTVTAKLTNNGTDIFDSHFIVTAVLNDSCRAWAQPEFIPELNAYRVFLTVPGFAANTGQNIIFEVEDLDNGAVFEPEYTPVTFSADAVSGNLGQAFVLNINTVGIEEGLEGAGHWLGQNQPNPFDGQTLIPYSLGQQTNVQMEVFDLVGNRVMTLVNGPQMAGNHNVSFDSGSLSAGMYMYVLTTGQGRQTKRMVVSK